MPVPPPPRCQSCGWPATALRALFEAGAVRILPEPWPPGTVAPIQLVAGDACPFCRDTLVWHEDAPPLPGQAMALLGDLVARFPPRPGERSYIAVCLTCGYCSAGSALPRPYDGSTIPVEMPDAGDVAHDPNEEIDALLADVEKQPGDRW